MNMGIQTTYLQNLGIGEYWQFSGGHRGTVNKLIVYDRNEGRWQFHVHADGESTKPHGYWDSSEEAFDAAQKWYQNPSTA